MGYTHYWRRKKVFDRELHARVVEDFRKLVPVLESIGVPLAGPTGEGAPVIEEDRIEFNGLLHCGHPTRDLGITWPAAGAHGVCLVLMENGDAGSDVGAHWFAGRQLLSRTCDGDCSHESFHLPRDMGDDPDTEPVFQFCKTAFKPYDLAVQACLVIARHHLGDAITVTSDGGPEEWRDARLLCQRFLGYGEDVPLEL